MSLHRNIESGQYLQFYPTSRASSSSYEGMDKDETGIFAGFDVQQKLNQNWSMLYESNVNNTQNKDGNNGVNGTAYKFAMGPALQLQVQPGVAPIASLTAAYVGGDQDITELPTNSEWRFGYRMEVWF
jgi:sucrose porin